MPNRWDQSAVFLQSGDPEKENAAPSPITGQLPYPGLLGTRFTIIEKGPAATNYSQGTFPPARAKTYQLVQTDSTAAVAPFPNAVAWWSDKTKYLVTTSASKLGRSRIAGRFPDNGAGGSISPGNFGCIQIAGAGQVRFINAVTSTPDATGKFVIPSATDGLADCITTGPTFAILGYSAGVYDGANAQCLVDLDVPTQTP